MLPCAPLSTTTLTRIPSSRASVMISWPSRRRALDDDLVSAVAAAVLGIGDSDLFVDEVEQHPLVLQAVEPEDAVGAADVGAFDHRRAADVEVRLPSAKSSIGVVSTRGGWPCRRGSPACGR
jgi:hypothetical protein